MIPHWHPRLASRRPRFLHSSSLFLWASLSLAPFTQAGEPVDFERQIRPLLTARCTECHGAEKQESGLQLDQGSLLLTGGNSGPAVVPGKSAESLLVEAISGGGELISKMPPEGERLSEAEVTLVKRWIDEGAKVPPTPAVAPVRRKNDHWSFQPRAKVSPPAVRDAAWPRNGIDHFVLSRLEAANLTPSPEADRVTLIRRLSFDLLGLPPSVAEVDAFLADSSPLAYERLVDRLLASPHYGERWGRHWLDIAHYADSNGYTIDGARSIWKYRDWVIAALNRDMPFDRFAIEQLAGDLLPNSSLDQQIATGFHRNTLVNEEGGTDPEQFRVEAVVDRVSTTGVAFLGLTLGCARCHDHKYDPISQREFYQLFAVFNNADEPALQVPSDQQAKEMPALAAEIAQAEKRLAEVDTNAGTRQAEWEKRFAGRTELAWTTLDIEATSASGLTFTRLDDQSLLVSGNIPDSATYQLIAPLPIADITAVRLEVITHDTLPGKGPGLADNGNFVLNELVAGVTPAVSGEAAAQPLKFNEAWADHSGNGGEVALAIDGKSASGWNISAPKDANVRRTAIFFVDPASKSPNGRLSLSLEQVYHKPRYLIGRLRISVTSAPRDVIRLPAAVREALAVPPAERSIEQLAAIKAEFQTIDPERVPLATRIAELKQNYKQMASAVTTTLVLREREQPRSTFIHVRGDFLHPGAAVSPAVPAALPDWTPRSARPDRLDFANWLVTPDHPLTARVTVNRIWQAYFGQGLVATENDFGQQGDRPTHPELLDWLANEWVAGGWSLKALHRTIVTSATYRQASHWRADLAAADPYNKLLGRQQRLRLEAETIRDAALSASGLLCHELGGPGVYPPQPEGIYRFTQQVKFWGESKSADRYRRGMYTYLWRSSPYPFLKTFDVPDAVVACTRRPRSNTPLQALTLANDRAFVEIAQGFARSLCEAPAGSDRERLLLAFRRCVAREPSAAELATLEGYFVSQQAHFGQAVEEAKAVLPEPLPPGVDPSQAAAWTMIARALLNTDEFITRE